MTSPRSPTLCMVVHAYYPLGEPRVQRESLGARRAGYEVTVLCLRGAGEAATDDIDGIHVRRMPMRHVRGAGLGRILFEYLGFCLLAGWWLARRSIWRPFDIVHVHNPPDFLVICGLIPRARGSRLVLDVHDLSAHMFSVRVSGRLAAAVAALLVAIERVAAACVDRVITVHEPYRRQLQRDGVAASKLEVVMNGVDEGILERARSASPVLPPSRRFRLAYHGTLTHWYGTDLIIGAIAELRLADIDVEGVILGDGDALPSLRERISDYQLDDRVHLSGRYLPIEEALATVATADCGIVPNRPSQINQFALSSKLFEYIALGIPVVVARLETLEGHFGTDEVTFFDPGDASSLAAAVRWVHDHPTEAETKVASAQVRARQYSWPRNREVLTGIYRDLTPAGIRLAASGSARDPGHLDLHREGDRQADPE